MIATNMLCLNKQQFHHSGNRVLGFVVIGGSSQSKPGLKAFSLKSFVAKIGNKF